VAIWVLFEPLNVAGWSADLPNDEIRARLLAINLEREPEPHKGSLFHRHRPVGPSRAAVFGYLQSFLGVLFAVALLGERVEPIQIAGGLVVIASVVLSRAHAEPARHLSR
jgi:uncharacterized membrane protein